jgi:hypothetical protein
VTHPTLTDWIQAIAGLLTMAAAVTALIIAAKAPRLAAKFAEQYRSESEARDHLQKLQVAVFLQLMAHRAELTSLPARQAVNAVDVLFAANADVRNARQMFMAAVNIRPTDGTLIVERYHNLIAAVARAVGVDNLIGPFDISQGYYPEAAGKLDLAAIAEAEEKLARKAAKDANDATGENKLGS